MINEEELNEVEEICWHVIEVEIGADVRDTREEWQRIEMEKK